MKIKSATRFTIFSTLTMTAGNLIFFLFTAAYFRGGVEVFAADTAFIVTLITVMTVGTAAVSYFISSLVVDRILNPIRNMTGNVKAISERRFKSARLVLDSSEDELMEYASAFNDMALKLNNYIEKQKRFVSDASHELATPLTIINGHADMLLRWGKDDPETLDEGLAVIRNEALRMNELVEKLLFFARTDSNRQEYSFADTDLNLLLESCAEEARGLYPEHCVVYEGIDLRPDDGIRPAVYVSCDADALRRVFRILFDNSVKHGGINLTVPDAGRITLSASACAGGRVEIKLADNGPGISPEHLELVFDRFFRSDESRAKKTGGSGLGLAIAKEIVERHGGSIAARNGGGGAVFVINLPFIKSSS